jgi:hypothetical protein
VVQFFDTPSDRVHYVLMEGVSGQIPAAAAQPLGGTIAIAQLYFFSSAF